MESRWVRTPEQLDTTSRAPPPDTAGLCIWLAGRPPTGVRAVAREMVAQLTASGWWVETLVDLPPTIPSPQGGRSSANWSSLAWVAGALTRRGAIVVAERPAGIRGPALELLRRAAHGVEVTLYASLPEEGDAEVPVLYRTVRDGQVEERRISEPPHDSGELSRIVSQGNRTRPSEVAAHVIERLTTLGALSPIGPALM